MEQSKFIKTITIGKQKAKIIITLNQCIKNIIIDHYHPNKHTKKEVFMHSILIIVNDVIWICEEKDNEFKILEYLKQVEQKLIDYLATLENTRIMSFEEEAKKLGFQRY